MNRINWEEEAAVAVTVSDREGTILYMNRKSASVFAKYGGKDLEGSNLRECHKPESWEKILEIMEGGKPNCYTIEKDGIRKMIYQAPWYSEGELAGMVELSMELPVVMDHFIRK